MFNFDGAINATNVKKAIQSSDIKVYSGNKIRFSAEAIQKLNLSGRNVIIQKLADGTLVIASTNSEAGNGRPVSDKGEFSHQALSGLLGGKDSEWAITGEGQVHPVTEDIYFALEQIVNGADVQKQLAEVANEVEPAHEHETVESEEEGIDELV